MGSILQLLIMARWEVICLLQYKMKFLLALLSATLVYGGHGDHGHIEYQQHDGPHCHDKKDQQCHKIPKTTCKKIVDTIFIEECEEIIHTVCEEAHQQYHHSQHVAGHESNVVAGSAGFHEEHQGESYGHGHGGHGGY